MKKTLAVDTPGASVDVETGAKAAAAGMSREVSIRDTLTPEEIEAGVIFKRMSHELGRNAESDAVCRPDRAREAALAHEHVQRPPGDRVDADSDDLKREGREGRALHEGNVGLPAYGLTKSIRRDGTPPNADNRRPSDRDHVATLMEPACKEMARLFATPMRLSSLDAVCSRSDAVPYLSARSRR